MALNYTSLQTTALNLLKANGQAISFTYSADRVVNPATGAVTQAGSTTTLSGFGAATKYKNIEIDGEAIKAGDLRLICNNTKLGETEIKPEQGWNVLTNSATWRVMDVEELNPAGINVIYICQLRK